MKTMSGLISNMKDRWVLFQKEVSDSGWTDYIKAQLTDLGNRLDAMAEDGRLKKLADGISDTFIAIAESIKAVFSNLTIDEVIQKTTAGFQSIVDSSTGVIQTFTVLGNSISVVFNSFSLTVKGIATLVTGAIGQIAKSAAGIAGALGFDETQEKLKSFADGTKAITQAFASGVAEDAQDIRNNFGSISEALTSSPPQIAEILKKARDSIKDTSKEVKKTNEDVKESTEDNVSTAETLYGNLQTALDEINTSNLLLHSLLQESSVLSIQAATSMSVSHLGTKTNCWKC